jgi:hypothetical protein
MPRSSFSRDERCANARPHASLGYKRQHRRYLSLPSPRGRLRYANRWADAKSEALMMVSNAAAPSPPLT